MSITAPTTFTTNVLIADDIFTNSGVEVAPTNAFCGLELQSTLSALVVSRVTSTQRDAMTPTNGMVIYNTTTNVFQFRENAAWVNFATSGGGGAVTGPVSSTNTAIARWNGTGGNQLEDSVVLVSNSGVITGVGTIEIAPGLAALPSYVFAADLTSGMWQSAADNLDFAANGLEVLNLTATAVAVNHLNINASATGAPVTINALGTDTNISLKLTPKGTGSVVVPVGAITTPSIAFATDLTTGLYLSAAGVIGLSCSGSEVALISETGIELQGAAPTNAAVGVISIPTGTAPTGMTLDSIGLYAITATSGGSNTRTLGMYTDVTPVAAVALTAPGLSFPIVINGTTYYIACKATQN